MIIAGMKRWRCNRCGEITLEMTARELSIPASLEKVAAAAR